MEKYICDVCGYIYDPAAGDPMSEIPPGTEFAHLAPSYTCPVCGALKSRFSPVKE